jgi:hypothetical protein
MNKTKLSLSALLAASLLGNVYLLAGGQYGQVQIQPDTITSDLLQAADPACAAEVSLVGANPTCRIGRTHLGDDPDWTEGWECNGAFMPKPVQTCLDKAAAKLPKDETGQARYLEARPELEPKQ